MRERDSYSKSFHFVFTVKIYLECMYKARINVIQRGGRIMVVRLSPFYKYLTVRKV